MSVEKQLRKSHYNKNNNVEDYEHNYVINQEQIHKRKRNKSENMQYVSLISIYG